MAGARDPGDPGAPSIEAATEAELVARCRAGDKAAFDRLYREQRRMVAASLYRVIGGRDELEDLVQEVFVVAFRGLDRFRGDARLSTWLYRICINVALGHLRKKSRRPRPAPLESAPSERVEDSPDSPERLLERREDVVRVYAALDTLSAKKRIVLVMHEIEGLDLKAIASIVGAPQVTVRTRLFYARREFYAALAASGAAGAKAAPLARKP
jgi:RNA polymerase sigma-70 factor (ECF subfamily)